MSMLSSIGWGAIGAGVSRLPIPGAVAVGSAISIFAGGNTVSRATPQLPSGFSPGGGFGGPMGPVDVVNRIMHPGTAVTQAPKGYHLNKHALAATKKHKALPAHSIWVRNRQINPLNHRALTRSLRRLKRATKLVRKLHGVGGGQRRLTAGSGGHRPGCGCFRCRKR